MVGGGLKQQAQREGGQQDQAGGDKSVLEAQHLGLAGDAARGGERYLDLGRGQDALLVAEYQRQRPQGQPDGKALRLQGFSRQKR